MWKDKGQCEEISLSDTRVRLEKELIEGWRGERQNDGKRYNTKKAHKINEIKENKLNPNQFHPKYPNNLGISERLMDIRIMPSYMKHIRIIGNRLVTPFSSSQSTNHKIRHHCRNFLPPKRVRIARHQTPFLSFIFNEASDWLWTYENALLRLSWDPKENRTRPAFNILMRRGKTPQTAAESISKICYP